MPPRADEATILQPQGTVTAPPYAYVQSLVREREQLYGATGVAATDAAAEDRSTLRSRGPLRGRSFDLLAREIRARRQLLRDPAIPKAYRKLTKALRPGSAMLADFAIRIPALLAAKPMVASMEPTGEDDAAQAASSRIEDFVHAVLFGREGQRALLDRGRTSVWRDVYDNAAALGAAGWLLTCRADRWSEADPNFPQRRRFRVDPLEQRQDPVAARRGAAERYTRAVGRYKQSLLPFTLEAVDPTTFYAREDEEGIEDEAVVITLRPYRETLQRYGLQPAEGVAGAGAHGPDILQGRSSKYVAGPAGLGRPFAAEEWPIAARVQEGVECVAYYCSARRAQYLGLVPAGADPDAGVWAYFVDGIAVACDLLWGPAWHPLPLFTPLGLTTALQDPNYRGVSALFTLIDLADALDEILTMERHVAYWSAWPPLIERDLSGSGGATGLPAQTVVDPEAAQRPDQAAAKDKKTIEPAGFYALPPGKVWEWLVLPAEATSHIERLKADVQGYLDLLGVPAALRGGSPLGGESGYHAALVQVAARLVYDPIVENVTLQAQQSVQYLLWQIWKRFPEGVTAQASSGAPPLGRRGPKRLSRAAVTVHPRDIAPEWASPRDPGVPVLDCTVTADPLLPIDEMQLEQRGINAVAAGMVDRDGAREKYFGDPAPERTAALIIADQAMQLPIVTESLAIRTAVRMGVLPAALAPLYLAARVGIPLELAQQQLAHIGATAGGVESDAAAQQAAQQQAAGGIAAGGLAPGQQAIPGVPGVPGVPQVGLPPLAPAMGAAPMGGPGSVGGPTGASLYPGQGPGYPVNSGGAMPPTQPTPQQRLAAVTGRGM